MNTQHAPEGWDVARAAEEVRAAGHSLYSQGVGDGHPMCRAYGRDYEEGKQDLRVAIEALIAAARAEGATAERARLAGMASEEDRGMETENIAAAQLREAIFVAQGEGYSPTSDWVTWLMDRLTGYRARLAAARGEGTVCTNGEPQGFGPVLRPVPNTIQPPPTPSPAGGGEDVCLPPARVIEVAILRTLEGWRDVDLSAAEPERRRIFARQCALLAAPTKGEGE